MAHERELKQQEQAFVEQLTRIHEMKGEQDTEQLQAKISTLKSSNWDLQGMLWQMKKKAKLMAGDHSVQELKLSVETLTW